MTKKTKVKSSIYSPTLPSYTRRVGAYILDFILLATLIVGVAYLLSIIMHYDATKAAVEQKYIEHGLKVFDAEANKYVVVADEKVYQEASLAFNRDAEAQALWQSMFKKTIAMLSISTIFSLVILELIVPLLFKNGRTVGKYVFKIALITKDDIKVKFKNMFIRTLIGKIVINYLVPILTAIIIAFSGGSLFLYMILLIIALANIYTIFGTKLHQSIPDYIGMVYSCDYENQVFFDTIEQLNDAKCKEDRIKNKNKGI